MTKHIMRITASHPAICTYSRPICYPCRESELTPAQLVCTTRASGLAAQHRGIVGRGTSVGVLCMAGAAACSSPQGRGAARLWLRCFVRAQEELNREFDAMDSNGDGVLDRAEYEVGGGNGGA